MRSLLPLALLVLIAGCAGTPAESPYAEEADRSIKALSDDEVRGLLAGEGLGYAMAAELNGYPGPRHVLDLAERLAVTDAQLVQIQGIFDRMQAEASAAGRRLVDHELLLDSLFATGNIDRERLSRIVEQIGRVESELRATHLAAHLEMTEILSPHQIALYDQARGYSDVDRSAVDHSAHGE